MRNVSVLSKKSVSVVSSAMAFVDPEMAKKMIEADYYSGQRNLRPWHVAELAEAMSRNKFTEGTQIHFCKLGDKKYNVNGNHTLHAIVESGVGINLSVLMTEVASEEEVAEHYSRHDRHLARTLEDAVKAHGVEKKLGITGQQITKANAGIKMILNEFANTRHANRYEIRAHDERVALLTGEYAEAATEYFTAIRGASKSVAKQLMTAAVVGVGLLTFKTNAEAAKPFWTHVASGAGIKRGDPRHSLMMWLLDHPLTEYPAAYRARVVEKAWNVYRAGGEIIRFNKIDMAEGIKLT